MELAGIENSKQHLETLTFSVRGLSLDLQTDV